MNKPVTVEVSELRDNIMKILNNSSLHPIILEIITRDIHSEVVGYLKNFTTKEHQMYSQQLEENEKINNLEKIIKDELEEDFSEEE